jgi:hypothetical protein
MFGKIGYLIRLGGAICLNQLVSRVFCAREAHENAKEMEEM